MLALHKISSRDAVNILWSMMARTANAQNMWTCTYELKVACTCTQRRQSHLIMSMHTYIDSMSWWLMHVQKPFLDTLGSQCFASQDV